MDHDLLVISTAIPDVPVTLPPGRPAAPQWRYGPGAASGSTSHQRGGRVDADFDGDRALSTSDGRLGAQPRWRSKSSTSPVNSFRKSLLTFPGYER